MIHAAIDPGKTGAMCFFDDETKKMWHVKMPAVIKEIVALFKDNNVEKVYLEKVGTHKIGNSASSSAKLAYHYGTLVGILSTLGISYIEILPQKWIEKIQGCPKGNARYLERKTYIHNVVNGLYPELTIRKYQADAVAFMTVMARPELLGVKDGNKS